MKRIVLLLAVAVPSLLYAQSTVSQTSKISDLGFIAGSWKTTTDWGEMNEVWSPPLGNCMMCSYRCVKNGKVVFYEFVLIEQNDTDPVPVMKLRHFSPGSVGWEDKTSPYLYPLIEVTPTKATFQAVDKKTTLSYERTSATTLKAVLIQDKEGKKTATEFLFSSL